MLNPQALDQFEQSLACIPNLKFVRNAPMSQYTTLRLGGPADFLCEPSSAGQLQAALRAACDAAMPVTLMGHGSNLLVKDGGIRGLVIRLCREMRRITVEGNTLRAEAGAMRSSAAIAAAGHHLGAGRRIFRADASGRRGGAVTAARPCRHQGTVL